MPPKERLHRSPALSIPTVLWADAESERDPFAETVHVSLCRPGSGEARLRLEADGLGVLDLDLSSSARLARGVQTVLALLGASG